MKSLLRAKKRTKRDGTNRKLNDVINTDDQIQDVGKLYQPSEEDISAENQIEFNKIEQLNNQKVVKKEDTGNSEPNSPTTYSQFLRVNTM